MRILRWISHSVVERAFVVSAALVGAICGLTMLGWQIYYLWLKLADIRIVKWADVLFPLEALACNLFITCVYAAIAFPTFLIFWAVFTLKDEIGED